MRPRIAPVWRLCRGRQWDDIRADGRACRYATSKDLCLEWSVHLGPPPGRASHAVHGVPGRLPPSGFPPEFLPVPSRAGCRTLDSHQSFYRFPATGPLPGRLPHPGFSPEFLPVPGRRPPPGQAAALWILTRVSTGSRPPAPSRAGCRTLDSHQIFRWFVTFLLRRRTPPGQSFKLLREVRGEP